MFRCAARESGEGCQLFQSTKVTPRTLGINSSIFLSLLPSPASSPASNSDSAHRWLTHVWTGGRLPEPTCGRSCFLASQTRTCWLSYKTRGCSRSAWRVVTSWRGLRSPTTVTSNNSKPTCVTGFSLSLFPSFINPLLIGMSGSLRLKAPTEPS